MKKDAKSERIETSFIHRWLTYSIQYESISFLHILVRAVESLRERFVVGLCLSMLARCLCPGVWNVRWIVSVPHCLPFFSCAFIFLARGRGKHNIILIHIISVLFLSRSHWKRRKNRDRKKIVFFFHCCKWSKCRQFSNSIFETNGVQRNKILVWSLPCVRPRVTVFAVCAEKKTTKLFQRTKRRKSKPFRNEENRNPANDCKKEKQSVQIRENNKKKNQNLHHQAQNWRRSVASTRCCKNEWINDFANA